MAYFSFWFQNNKIIFKLHLQYYSKNWGEIIFFKPLNLSNVTVKTFIMLQKISIFKYLWLKLL